MSKSIHRLPVDLNPQDWKEINDFLVTEIDEEMRELYIRDYAARKAARVRKLNEDIFAAMGV